LYARWFNLAADIWVLLFAASFLLSIVVGAIQMFRGKEIWDTPLLPLMVILHFAWVLPLVSPFLAVYFVFWAIGRAGRTVARCLKRHPKP